MTLPLQRLCSRYRDSYLYFIDLSNISQSAKMSDNLIRILLLINYGFRICIILRKDYYSQSVLFL